MPFSSGCTTNMNQFITAKNVQKKLIDAYALYHSNPSDDVKKLESIAPMTLPRLGDEHHNPKIVPLPLFPNQFVNIATQAGHPID